MKRVFVPGTATHTRLVVEEPAANQVENPQLQLFLALKSLECIQLENLLNCFLNALAKRWPLFSHK